MNLMYSIKIMHTNMIFQCQMNKVASVMEKPISIWINMCIMTLLSYVSMKDMNVAILDVV